MLAREPSPSQGPKETRQTKTGRSGQFRPARAQSSRRVTSSGRGCVVHAVVLARGGECLYQFVRAERTRLRTGHSPRIRKPFVRLIAPCWLALVELPPVG